VSSRIADHVRIALPSHARDTHAGLAALVEPGARLSCAPTTPALVHRVRLRCMSLPTMSTSPSKSTSAPSSSQCTHCPLRTRHRRRHEGGWPSRNQWRRPRRRGRVSCHVEVPDGPGAGRMVDSYRFVFRELRQAVLAIDPDAAARHRPDDQFVEAVSVEFDCPYGAWNSRAFSVESVGATTMSTSNRTGREPSDAASTRSIAPCIGHRSRRRGRGVCSRRRSGVRPRGRRVITALWRARAS
jgi:hypothetical protein